MRSVFTGTKVTKSVVLAGGQGTSLTPLAKYRPVPMVSVLNRPLIEHTITRLKKSGMTDIIIAGSRGSHSPTYYKEFRSNTVESPKVRYVMIGSGMTSTT
jgi:NDP-sugar pyrophosphorylase family protein